MPTRRKLVSASAAAATAMHSTSAVTLPSSGYTVAFWFKRNGSNANNTIFASQNGQDQFYTLSTNVLRCRYGNSSDGGDGTIPTPDGTWIHVCVQCGLNISGSDDVVVYVNGALDTAGEMASGASESASGGTLYLLGDDANGANSDDGYAGEVFDFCIAAGLHAPGAMNYDGGSWQELDVTPAANLIVRLDGQNAGDPGADSSGLENDFTVENGGITLSDSALPAGANPGGGTTDAAGAAAGTGAGAGAGASEAAAAAAAAGTAAGSAAGAAIVPAAGAATGSAAAAAESLSGAAGAAAGTSAAAADGGSAAAASAASAGSVTAAAVGAASAQASGAAAGAAAATGASAADSAGAAAGTGSAAAAGLALVAGSGASTAGAQAAATGAAAAGAEGVAAGVTEATAAGSSSAAAAGAAAGIGAAAAMAATGDLVTWPAGEAGSAEFDGAIDAGWSVAGPSFDGFSVEDGRLKVAFDPGEDFDPGTANNNAGSNAPRIERDAPAGDFDVYTMISSDPKVEDAQFAGMGFHLRTASSTARLELYQQLGQRIVIAYAKYATTAPATNAPDGPAANGQGFPTHLHLNRTGDTFTFSASYNGADWEVVAQFDWAVALTKLGVHFFQIDNGTAATTFLLDHVHMGVPALPVANAASRTPVLEEDFADLAAWDDESGNGGSASVSGGVLTLSCTSTDRSTGRVATQAAFAADQGLVCAVERASTANVNLYFGIVLRGQGEPAGQYTLDEAVVYEGNHSSGLVRMLRSAGPHSAADGAEWAYIYQATVAAASIADRTWIRFEAVGPIRRFRVWNDGDPEPAEWTASVVDGAVKDGGRVAFALSHNDGDAVAGSIEISGLEVYELSAAVAVTSEAVGVSAGAATAAAAGASGAAAAGMASASAETAGIGAGVVSAAGASASAAVVAANASGVIAAIGASSGAGSASGAALPTYGGTGLAGGFGVTVGYGAALAAAAGGAAGTSAAAAYNVALSSRRRRATGVDDPPGSVNQRAAGTVGGNQAAGTVGARR